MFDILQIIYLDDSGGAIPRWRLGADIDCRLIDVRDSTLVYHGYNCHRQIDSHGVDVGKPQETQQNERMSSSPASCQVFHFIISSNEKVSDQYIRQTKTN